MIPPAFVLLRERFEVRISIRPNRLDDLPIGSMAISNRYANQASIWTIEQIYELLDLAKRRDAIIGGGCSLPGCTVPKNDYFQRRIRVFLVEAILTPKTKFLCIIRQFIFLSHVFLSIRCGDQTEKCVTEKC